MRGLLIGLGLLSLPVSTVMAANIDAAAKDACKCLEAPYGEVEKAMKFVEEAQASGDMSKLMALQGDMMAVMNSTSKCFEGLSKKYTKIDKDPDLQAKVMEKVDKLCPNPADAMKPR